MKRKRGKLPKKLMLGLNPCVGRRCSGSTVPWLEWGFNSENFFPFLSKKYLFIVEKWEKTVHDILHYAEITTLNTFNVYVWIHILRIYNTYVHILVIIYKYILTRMKAYWQSSLWNFLNFVINLFLHQQIQHLINILLFLIVFHCLELP